MTPSYLRCQANVGTFQIFHAKALACEPSTPLSEIAPQPPSPTSSRPRPLPLG